MDTKVVILCWLFCTVYTVLADSSSVSCNRSYLGHLGSGVIKSYNYPFDYRHNLTCTHRIYLVPDSEEPRTICFSFHRFNLENSTPFCSFDYLKFDSTKYCSAGLWQYGRPTDSVESNVWYSNFCWPVKSEYFEVTFHSDNNINGRGFYATYNIHSGVEATLLTQPSIISGQAPCGPNEWTCFNRRCIPINDTCNGVDNCKDGSDESYMHARCGEQNLLACDFATVGGLSDGLCGFTQEGGEWFRSKSRISPYGPNADHTNSTHGYYIYTDGTHGPAYLVSPELTLPVNHSYCLSFWYFSYGSPPAATLSVYVGREQTYTRPEWSHNTATRGATSHWRQGQVNILASGPLRVVFGAVLGHSLSGIALDDFSVVEGKCEGDDVACNFESSLCGWQQVAGLPGLTANLEWRHHTRLNSPVGPLHDRSSKDGSGKYLLLAGNSNEPDVTWGTGQALLLSPAVSTSPEQAECLRFSYHMSGTSSNAGRIRVYTLDSQGKLSTPIWVKVSNTRGQWLETSIDISVDGPYQIILEGRISQNDRGEVAVDAVMLDGNPCSKKEEVSCGNTEYRCHDNVCIPSSQRCDLVPHCEDASDEGIDGGCPVSTSPFTTTEEPPCSPDQFHCHDRLKCIATSWTCDFFKDCDDNSDEGPETCPHLFTTTSISTSTTSPPCVTGEFTCNNGACVPRNLVCDGTFHCFDRSDEINCPTSVWTGQVRCGPGQFYCEVDRRCLSPSQVCDSEIHCSDGADESQEIAGCPVAVKTRGRTLGTSGAIGLGLGLLLIIIVIFINIMFFRRHKQCQSSRTNTSSATLAGDASTISYTEGSVGSSRVYDPMHPHSEHIYETLMEPSSPNLPRPPPYAPTAPPVEVVATVSPPRGYLRSREPPPIPPNHPSTFIPSEEPPPPYDACKDTLVLTPAQYRLASQWLQPSTSV